MKLILKMNSIVFVGIVLILGGIHVGFTGITRGAVLFGVERYIVVTVSIVAGLYCIYLGLRKNQSK